ncbi:MAG TPA: protein-arginine deiminase family protein [Pyrinomonadaceae bacterium]|nr:protein-arginine deiminase family protein [Pyrinomonadaceae bacterium]
MAHLIVRADFDHDGSISKSAAEQDLSQDSPGLIILPNIDVDGRILPPKVKKSAPIELDHQRSKTDADPDWASILVEVNTASAAKLRFSLIGPGAARFSVFDGKNQKLPQTKNQFDSTVSGVGAFPFFIEANSLPGTPLDSQEDDVPIHIAVNVDLLDAHNKELDTTQITVSTAPIILMGDLEPAQRIYICEIPEKDAIDRGNQPSISEVSEIVKKIPDVGLVLVPADVNNLDAWIQDQFQLGYCQSPSGLIRVIVHLPRMRSNVIQSEFQANLASFIPEHFPSRDLGIFQDFYERQVSSGKDKQGQSQKISFTNSYEFSLLFNRVWDLWAKIDILYPTHRKDNSRDKALEKLLVRLPTMSFFEARVFLKTAVGVMGLLLSRRQLNSDLKDGQKERLDREAKHLNIQFALVEKTIPLDLAKNLEKLTVVTQALGEITLTKTEVNTLNDKLSILHSSINYGGNLEVSGPTDDARFGKVILGSHTAADPSLLHFLKSQRVQPIVDVDTSWLHVAHVDEVMTFLPAVKSDKSAFRIAVASPQVAMKILDTAWAMHVERGGTKAVTAGDDIDILHPARRDLTVSGTAPLTRMLRGRYWLHHNPEGVFEEHKPPQIYLDMLEHYPLLPNVIDYNPEPGQDRYYEAALSVREFRNFGRFTNDWLGSNQQSILQQKLSQEFPDVPQVTIPILYDEVPWTTDSETKKDMPDFENHRTSAFLPNSVNMQIINEHLLIPKPFGPRTSPDVAAAILKKVMPAQYHDNLNKTYFAKKKLDQVYHWIKRPLIPGSDSSDLNRLTMQFKDGFPGLEEDKIRSLIQEANPNHFGKKRNPVDDGFNLTAGWHKLRIPEKTVDLFEAFIQVQLEALGLTVHFVDSWYYHIRLGEIHCGTNVLRKAPKPKQKWWDFFPWWNFVKVG